ncbi:MAG: hypothetical protein ACPGVP_21230, partial [Thiolinea sp.]
TEGSDSTDETDDDDTETSDFAVDVGESLSYPLQYNGTGSLLVMGNRNNAIQVRNPGTSNLIQTATSSHNWTHAIALSTSGNRFASGGRDSAIRVWMRTNVSLSNPGTIRTASWVRG